MSCIEQFFEITPFEILIFCENKVDNDANAKYGSLTTIGLQFFGSKLTNSFLIKQALAETFFKSFLYFIFEKKVRSFILESRIVFILLNVSPLFMFEQHQLKV